MRFQVVILFISFIFFTSCHKDKSSDFSADEKEIISFKFEKELNSSLPEDLEGTVLNSEILLTASEVIDASALTATFEFAGESVYVKDKKQESGVDENDFSKPITYDVFDQEGNSKSYAVKITTLPDIKSEVPHIYITTDGEEPVVSKENYLEADIFVDGKEVYEDFEGRTKIRGRGNDSWNQPKKPYKLKLFDKKEILGLLPGKKWILRSNYRAESLMLDAVAFRMASLLDMPYSHHAVPVDITLNGEYMGSYTFTEQKEVKSNRINVGSEGLYLNLDTYMHKPPGLFYSEFFELPVMIRYPKFKNFSPSEVESELERIKNDFKSFEEKVAAADFPENDYLDDFDALELVNYLIVYNLSLNREINHPKSTFVHKHKNGKYKMGPVWDFDWAFGYDANLNQHFTTPEKPLFVSEDLIGKTFFSKFLEDPEIIELYKERWNWFRTNKFPMLIQYIEDYAEVIEGSYALDYDKWGQGVGDAETAAAELIDWLNQRAAYMDGYISGL